ncbi:MAG: Fur family transcriptional regulator [Verrucomicrobiae bacterium]|nr:Fur family transcriptional regulator [Verrucomicrobiae bacterium]
MARHVKALPSRVESLLNECRKHGLRRTRPLETVLTVLAAGNTPISWSQLTREKSIKEACDPATVFRLVTRLEKAGLVRKLGTHSRSIHYFLHVPGDDHHDFLVCSECGVIKSIDIACPVEKIERAIERSSGFKNLYHELEFYGLCPECQP